MRFFLDTEFVENGSTIDLISIGIVAEDGREYYAISTEFNPDNASQWVIDNVLSKLPPIMIGQPHSFNRPFWKKPKWKPDVIAPSFEYSPNQIELAKAWKNRETIKLEVLDFLGGEAISHQIGGSKRYFQFLGHGGIEVTHESTVTQYRLKPGHPKPEFWAYYADYDWVVFCQLFGTMMDLPDGFPMYCNDLQQDAYRLGLDLSVVPQQNEHNALDDARWVKQAHEYVLDGCRQQFTEVAK